LLRQDILLRVVHVQGRLCRDLDAGREPRKRGGMVGGAGLAGDLSFLGSRVQLAHHYIRAFSHHSSRGEADELEGIAEALVGTLDIIPAALDLDLEIRVVSSRDRVLAG
jgi:hypothetical protein